MRFFFASIVCLAFALTAIGQDENILNPALMFRGDIGKLPRTTKSNWYEAYRTFDDEVLILQMEKQNNSVKPSARFFVRDAEFVKKYEGLTGTQRESPIVEMPDVYKVVGTKNLGATLPVIAIHKKIKSEKK